jgi:phosphatidylserine/phosphatidylglycerophosphate/cardiolipin synthase-like enzyme
MICPTGPLGHSGADTTRGQLGALLEADGGAGRLLATTLSAQQGTASSPLYVHAKIGIVDDHWLTIGSANLNDHSLFNDTELNVITCDPEMARDTRLRLSVWSEHLQADRIDGAPGTVIDQMWRRSVSGSTPASNPARPRPTDCPCCRPCRGAPNASPDHFAAYWWTADPPTAEAPLT